MDPFTDASRDLRKRREIVLSTGNKYIVELRDPYGFWHIHMEKGQTPAELQGAYTTFDKAETAVKLYVENKQPVFKKVVEVKK